MQPVVNYITYSRTLTYEPQSLYLECGQGNRICSNLKDLGTKRILVMSRDEYLKARNVVDLISKLEESGFRVFNYVIKQRYSSSTDIVAALDDYLGFNCDTIVVFGGGAEIFCAKMVSAMALNNMKDPSEAEGYGKIKKDISVLCCIGMDNSTAISSNIAEFRDENTGRWVSVISNYLVPQIAVVDTDIAMRTFTRVSLTSALDTLAMGIESCLSPASVYDAGYKACARNAISLIIDNVVAMKEQPDDGFLRKKIAVAGIYAGMGARMSGFGYSHLAIHALKSRFGPDLGKFYCRVLSRFLKESFGLTKYELADIYNNIVRDEVRPGFAVMNGVPEPLYSVDSAAEALIKLLDDLYKAVVRDEPDFPSIPKASIHDICEEVRLEAEKFGLVRLDEELITRTLENL